MEPSPPPQAYTERPNQKRPKVDSELPNDNLSAQCLTLDHCYITEVLAFPRSLAVFRGGIFHWNATCWLDRFPIPQLVMRKIADHCNTATLHKGQICEFKGSPMSIEGFSHAPDIRLLVVFPHMNKPFDSEEVQRIWTNDIVIPSVSRHVNSNVQQYLPGNYNILRLNSQAKRIGLGLDVADTPLCVAFRSDNLQGVWADIVSKTQQKGFEEFRGAFLVAFGQWHPTVTLDKSMEGAWKSLVREWDLEMDMNYIPVETFEVRMESQYGLSG